MTSRKVWVWVLGGLAAAVVLTVVAIAAAGAYFATRHIQTTRTSAPEALQAFDEIRHRFPSTQPLYELDSENEPRLVRPLADIPTAERAASELRLLAWQPDEERLVRVSLPIWLLRFGHHRMSVTGHERTFDLEHLNLDPPELERIGPALVFDLRDQDGVRVLVWTQ